LSGTLDTFALPDVLRLLATTRKSGRLDLDLDLDDATGHGGLWLVDGKVAAAAPPAAAGAVQAAPPSVDVLFELLRCREGSFTFEVGVRCELDGPAGEVEVLLAGAEELLAEWREIEAVVPSLRTTLSLRAELAAATATVTSEQWRLVVGVGSGTTVGALGAARGLGELAVSRAVKGLVEAGLVEVGPAAPGEPAVRRDLALSFDVGATVTDAEWRAELRAGTPVRPPVLDDAPELAAPWDAVLPSDTASAALSELAAEEPQPVSPTRRPRSTTRPPTWPAA
jgi:hypothetical protein